MIQDDFDDRMGLLYALTGGNQRQRPASARNQPTGARFTARPPPRRPRSSYRFTVNIEEESKESPGAQEEQSLSQSRLDEESKTPPRPVQRGFFKKAVGIVASFFKKIWRGIVWLFETEANPRAGAPTQNPNRDFNQRFQT